jgi:sortase (surface protein transpeptidase)
LDMSSGGYLIIPSIGVKAPIEEVGVDKDGHMAVPTKNGWNSVGWYQKGTRPGGIGSAVMDGHLDRPGGSPAVFWKLDSLHNGDLVSVKDKSGHTLHFKVIKSAYYAPDNAPLSQIYGKDDGAFLNLITCGGDWIVDQHQYSKRLVVYTQLAA